MCIDFITDTAARIFLWTSLRLEVINKAVQLYCRAEGVPSPAVTWFDKHGQEIPLENENYKVQSHWQTRSVKFPWSWKTIDKNRTKLKNLSLRIFFCFLQILENGDLLIKRLIWEQMGEYVCQASNMKGQDSQKIFIYPMAVSTKLDIIFNAKPGNINLFFFLITCGHVPIKINFSFRFTD